METREFKVGDRVKVSLDIPSVFRGRTGTIQRLLSEDAGIFYYMVTFDSGGLRTTIRFSEQQPKL